MSVWFTSDTHFAHANVIKYCGRPFADVEEMNETMVARWNARVQPEDTIYHLGDFAFGPVENIGKFLARLNGNVTLVLGNHDRSLKRMRSILGSTKVWQSITVIVDRKLLYLRHKPDAEWATGAKCATDPGPPDYHLHGHVHEKYARRGNAINVGVDVRDFEPKTLEELLASPA